MPCDAFKVWLDIVDGLKVEDKIIGIGTWSKAWKGILQGEQYLEYKFEVVDEDSGELLEQFMSCDVSMNKLMVKQNWYPKIIQQAFQKYKS